MNRVGAWTVAVLMAGSVGWTGEHPEHPKSAPSKAEGIKATLVGENFCVGCSLKKEKGAAAQCGKYGHRHALKVMSAKADEGKVPMMKGWVLHYLETDRGQLVIAGHHGKTITLKGKVYEEERIMEVDEVVKATGEDKASEHPEHPKKPEHPEHPK